MVRSVISDQLIFAAIDLWLHLRHFKMLRELEATYDTPHRIARPRTYVERMLWRRFIDRNPAFAIYSDKLATKKLILERCPEANLARTLWVGESPDAIPPELRKPGVWLKACHGSGFNHRITGEAGEVREIRRKATSWLRTDYRRQNEEWGYHLVRRRIFLEEAITPESGVLWEINIRAAGGRFLLGSLMRDAKTPRQWVCFLDENGEVVNGPGDPDGMPPRQAPEGLDYRAVYQEAIRQALLVTRDLDYARVDSLWDGRRLWAGEVTLYPAAGLRKPANSGVARLLRRGWDLRESHFLRRTDLGPLARRYAEALRRELDRDARAEASASAISSRG